MFLRAAQRVGAVAEAYGARVWVSCEAYYAEADAVNFIAEAYGIRTVAWQYSTLAQPSFVMVTQADITATFSDSFAAQYTSSFTGPDSVRPLGFPFGDVADLVRARSIALRAELAARGATFIIAFFDEGVASGHWHGLFAPTDHLAQLEELASAVVRDPTLAVVLKSKFARDNYERFYPQSTLLRDAFATGRFRQLAHGRHRNVVFATEAALASDLVLGLLAGGTAVAEGAIAGVRAVLLKVRGERSRIEPMLEGLDVVYPTVTAVLTAVGKLRSGDGSAAALGDWSTVIERFDAHRDGGAPRRLRALLESLAVPEGRDA